MYIYLPYSTSDSPEINFWLEWIFASSIVERDLFVSNRTLIVTIYRVNPPMNLPS